MLSPDDLICSTLRGEAPGWPVNDDGSLRALVINCASHNGVAALLYERLTSRKESVHWPVPVLQDLRALVVPQAMWELRHQRILRDTLSSLLACGVQPVLVKGTALAYSLFPDPALRTRSDTDLLIPLEARQLVNRRLLELGYQRDAGMSGEFVSYQATYTRWAQDGSSHTLDLHWKINNSELLSRLFTYAELRNDAEPLPALCPGALRTSSVRAMLIACMHRLTHRQNPYYVNGHAHDSANRLIWLYDLHLLASKLTSSEWKDLVRLATEKQLCSVCLDGLQQAAGRFLTSCPPEVLRALARAVEEMPARYLDGSKMRQQWMDFRALRSPLKQLRFVREVLFPPDAYMRAKYPGTSQAWFPVLYVRRMIGGVFARLFQRGPRG